MPQTSNAALTNLLGPSDSGWACPNFTTPEAEDKMGLNVQDFLIRGNMRKDE